MLLEFKHLALSSRCAACLRWETKVNYNNTFAASIVKAFCRSGLSVYTEQTGCGGCGGCGFGVRVVGMGWEGGEWELRRVE